VTSVTLAVYAKNKVVVETIDIPGSDESLLEILESSNDLPNDSAADQQPTMSDLPE
jgi:hypothetical protein